MTFVVQDNLLTIAVVKAEKCTSDRIRHIDICYYLVYQYLKDGVITIQRYPASAMISDLPVYPATSGSNVILFVSEIYF